jgi:hypothetical protein
MAMTWQEAQALGMGDQWMAQKYGSQSAQPEWQDLKAANPDLATWIDLNDQHYLNAGYLPPGSYQQPSNQQPSNYLQGSVYSTPVGEKIDYGNNGTWSPGMKTSFGGGADLNQRLGAPRGSNQFMPDADPATRVSEYFKQNPLQPTGAERSVDTPPAQAPAQQPATPNNQMNWGGLLNQLQNSPQAMQFVNQRLGVGGKGGQAPPPQPQAPEAAPAPATPEVSDDPITRYRTQINQARALREPTAVEQPVQQQTQVGGKGGNATMPAYAQRGINQNRAVGGKGGNAAPPQQYNTVGGKGGNANTPNQYGGY